MYNRMDGLLSESQERFALQTAEYQFGTTRVWEAHVGMLSVLTSAMGIICALVTISPTGENARMED